MLTEQEKKELNYKNLSPELKKKIDAAFGNPFFNVVIALSCQKMASEQEFILDPFLINGSSEKSRQEMETALKVAEWLPKVAYDIEKLQEKLQVNEKKEAETILSGNGETIKKKVRELHGL